MAGYGGYTPIPESESLQINGGASICYSRSVTLTLFCKFAYEMQIANGSDPTSATWEAYYTSKAWTLTESAGTKTVSVRYRTVNPIHSGIATATIEYQDGPPSTFKEVLEEDMANLFCDDSTFAVSLTVSSKTFNAFWEDMDTTQEDRADGRWLLKRARTIIPTIQVSSIDINQSITKDGEIWLVQSIDDKDSAGQSITVSREVALDRSGKEGRRKS